MIHHVSIEASDLERSGAFYDATLAALGWRRHADSDRGVELGDPKAGVLRLPERRCDAGLGPRLLRRERDPAVKAAWEAGIEAGGTDDGEPGSRPQYGAGYYSAYLLDPDGYRVEIAVSSQ